MNEILEKSKENTAAKEKAQQTSAASKQTAAEKAAAKKTLDNANKAKKTSKRSHLESIWWQCGDRCTCPYVYVHNKRVPCPAKGLKCCDQCGDIKKQVCKKQACVAAAALQLLA